MENFKVNNNNTRPLTSFERSVIERKGTEAPFTGVFVNHTEMGTYHCRKCHAALYRSEQKFSSNCGWPSFDDEILGAVTRLPDPDGRRTEIVCSQCGAHLGHVFEGEGFTSKNIRHCVNSVSMTFTSDQVNMSKKAVFASGCFWGTEFHFAKKTGVLSTRVGYSGGEVPDPTYELVCKGETGHLEAVEVNYDPHRVSYRALLELFFETHDFSQRDGQGPDIGPQYLSAIFWNSENERTEALTIIEELRSKGYFVATELRPSARFFAAEEKHQLYYFRNGSTPYCHIYRKIF